MLFDRRSGGLRLRLASLVERLRTSLFFLPMLTVVGAIALGFAALAIDRRFDQDSTQLPFGLTSTVDSTRALLSTVAGATISFAGIAFSVSLLVLQRASTQYSPRVVQTLFRDPFNKRVMALVVGTFSYCLIVVRAVRSPLEDGGDAVIPNLSVAIATVLGVAAILATVAFINHSAHSMDVSEILERVRREATIQIRREWHCPEIGGTAVDEVPEPAEPAWSVRFDRTGWVQLVDVDALLGCVPPGATMRLETAPGRFAVEHTLLVTASEIPEDAEATAVGVRSAVHVGENRTVSRDVSYGLRQLVDVAIKALSPGINDPTTARDAIFHAVAVLAELLRREPPPAVRSGDDDRCLVLAEQPTHADLVGLTFDEVRRAAAPHPAVCVYLLEAIALLVESLDDERLAEQRALVTDHAAEVVVACAGAEPLPRDRALVEAAFAKRFAPA